MNIKAVAVQAYWDFVAEPIREIHARLDHPDYRPEDIYAQCLTGESVLFMDMDEPPGNSFFVATIKERPEGKVLFLWIASSIAAETADRSHEAIEHIAREVGCVAVEFETKEPKLAEHAENFGYKTQLITVRKDLQPLE